MKSSKLMLSIGVFIFGFTIQSFAQKVLPEIEIFAVNYKYLNSVGEQVSIPVKQLEREVADFDLKSSKYYKDEHKNYFITFFIPEGKILASYDKKGKLLRTAEKFKNVAMPMAVRQSVIKNYPQWSIQENVYLVNYYDSREIVKKRYKLVLVKGDKHLRVKVDEYGVII